MSEEVKEIKETEEAKEPKKSGWNESTTEIVVAILLGVTALLTAWATWVGSLHGGNQSTNYTKSNNMSADGNARWNEASQQMMQDMLLWNEISDLELEIQYAQLIDDYDTVELSAYKLYYKCFENLTDGMAAMIGFDFDEAAESEPVDYILDWIETDEAVTTPFSDEAYILSYYEDASAVLAESEALLEQGQADNANGDAFGLVTVIYSVVLFLLGIAGTFKNIPNRTIVIVIAAIGFMVATIYMFTIPMPTAFSIASFFAK